MQQNDGTSWTILWHACNRLHKWCVSNCGIGKHFLSYGKIVMVYAKKLRFETKKLAF